MKNSFNEIYEKIYKTSKEELETLKKKNTRDVIYLLLIIGVIAFIASFIDRIVPLIVIFMGMICFITFVAIMSTNYKALYKTKVIKTIVKDYSDDDNLDYYPISTISRMEYNASGFDIHYDDFHSEDEISGTLEDGSRLKMSQVTTIEETETVDSEGNRQTTRTVTFSGMYGYIKLNDLIIPNRIDVSSNSIFKTYAKNRIEVESAEFEKKYDISALDRLNAMQIFTADLIEKFVDLNSENKYILQMRIEDSIIYFRFRCGNVFEPPSFSTGVNYDLLYRYYSVINFPIEISEEIIKNAKAIKGDY